MNHRIPSENKTQTHLSFSRQKAAHAGVCDLKCGLVSLTVQGLSGFDSKPACTKLCMHAHTALSRTTTAHMEFRLINPTNPAQTQAMHAYCDCAVTSHGRAANCCQLVPDVSPSLQSSRSLSPGGMAARMLFSFYIYSTGQFRTIGAKCSSNGVCTGTVTDEQSCDSV
jgi:hypothetical protein